MIVSAELIPDWVIAREAGFRAKRMDESSLVPFERLSPLQQRRQAGRWLAYNYTLDDPRRAYVYDAAVALVRQHATTQQRKGHTSYTHVDLGAGNGANTIRTVSALQTTYADTIKSYLVEQSGPALNSAYQHFQNHGFPYQLSKTNSQTPGLSDSINRTHVYFQQEDITETSINTASVNAVTVVNVWHHLSWDKLQASTAEIERILKPGGLAVIIDTRPLPSASFLFGLPRTIVASKIREAVRVDKFLERAQKDGITLDEQTIEGIKDFSEHDAWLAFENAFTKKQFNEAIRKSALSATLQTVADLRSPHPFFKLVYPSLNIAWGTKPA